MQVDADIDFFGRFRVRAGRHESDGKKREKYQQEGERHAARHRLRFYEFVPAERILEFSPSRGPGVPYSAA